MLVHLLIWLIVIGLVFYLAYWVLSQIPLPPPFAVAARVILGIIAILVILTVLLPLADTGVGCSGNRLIC